MLSSRLARVCFNNKLCINSFKTQAVISRGFLTSKKNRDSTTTAATEVDAPKTEVKKSRWQTYGFGVTEQEDKLHMNLTFFFGVSITLVFLSFYIAYAPSDLDWEQREGFLELRRREQNGLPLVDRNYIDPSKIVLPSDEELGDTEIII